jgi:hypothetical protein
MNNRIYKILIEIKKTQRRIPGMGHVIFQGVAPEYLGGNQKNW